MKMTKERALIVRLTNTLDSVLTEMRKVADDCEDPASAHQVVNEKSMVLNEAKHYIGNSEAVAVNGRVYLFDPLHINHAGQFMGLKDAQAALKEAEEAYGKSITGISLARTIIDGMAAEVKMSLLDRNIRTAIAGGLNVTTAGLLMNVDKDGLYLTTSAEG